MFFYVYSGIAKFLLSHETAARLKLVSYINNIVSNAFPKNMGEIINSFLKVC